MGKAIAATPGRPETLAARAGVGLRAPHMSEVACTRPAVAWFEIHSENAFAPGGFSVDTLARVRADYAMSFHGVSLSLGSADPLNEAHLTRLTDVVERFAPVLVSEHVAWTSVGGRYLHDLLPVPYTEEVLHHMSARVAVVQDRLKRRILLENPSTYLVCARSDYDEPAFLVALARASGCGLLLDINNIYVNSVNQGFDPHAYVAAIPADLVEEIHLAGFAVERVLDHEILIDSHDHPVWPAVWALYEYAVSRWGPRPTLIERDAAIPPLASLLLEAARADAVMERYRGTG